MLGVGKANGFSWSWNSDEDVRKSKDHISINCSATNGTGTEVVMGTSEYGTYLYTDAHDMVNKYTPTSWNLGDYMEENTIDNGDYTLYYIIKIFGNNMSYSNAYFCLRNNASADMAAEECVLLKITINKQFHVSRGEEILAYYHKVKESYLDILGIDSTEEMKTVYKRGLESLVIENASINSPQEPENIEYDGQYVGDTNEDEDVIGDYDIMDDVDVIGDRDISNEFTMEDCRSWMMGLDIGCPRYNGNVADFDFSFCFPIPAYVCQQADGYIEADVSGVNLAMYVEAVDASRISYGEQLQENDGKLITKEIENDAKSSFLVRYYMTAPRSNDDVAEIVLSMTSIDENSLAEFRDDFLQLFEEMLVSNLY